MLTASITGLAPGDLSRKLKTTGELDASLASVSSLFGSSHGPVLISALIVRLFSLLGRPAALFLHEFMNSGTSNPEEEALGSAVISAAAAEGKQLMSFHICNNLGSL